MVDNSKRASASLGKIRRLFEAIKIGLATLLFAVSAFPAPPAKLPPPPENYSVYRVLYEDSALHPDLVKIYARSPVTRATAPTSTPQVAGLGLLLRDIALWEGKYGGQCVEFIQRLFKSYYTYPDFRGDARTIIPNAIKPEVGAAVLTVERSSVGHVAIVTAIDEDAGELTLADSNYGQDEIVHIGRKMKIGDLRIRGYFVFRPVL